MARRKQTQGKCTFCQKEMTKSGMAKHLATCPGREAARKLLSGKPGGVQKLYHLQVQDAWGGTFWLQLEMKGSAKLGDLDNYLRAIWLECCGHLSQFSVGGWRGDEIAMSRPIERVFQPGVELTHIYDFGTSSETMVKVIGVTNGQPLTKHPVFLMARNNMPEQVCMECGKPATYFCQECVYEHEATGALCDQHAENHPHDNYGEPMPLLNSPRTGMCGYSGPAEPPY